MDPEKAKQKRATRGTITISESHVKLDNAYEFVCLSSGRISNTGLLKVAELKPKEAKSELPSFLFRWHEEANHLNVDTINTSKAKSKKFRDGAPGYGGHLPIKIPSTSRVFHATICWDSQIIYDGDITIPLGYEATFDAKMGCHASASVQLSRKCRNCGQNFTVKNNEYTCPNCTEALGDISSSP